MQMKNTRMESYQKFALNGPIPALTGKVRSDVLFWHHTV